MYTLSVPQTLTQQLEFRGVKPQQLQRVFEVVFESRFGSMR